MRNGSGCGTAIYRPPNTRTLQGVVFGHLLTSKRLFTDTSWRVMVDRQVDPHQKCIGHRFDYIYYMFLSIWGSLLLRCFLDVFAWSGSSSNRGWFLTPRDFHHDQIGTLTAGMHYIFIVLLYILRRRS